MDRTTDPSTPRWATFADVLDHLGGIDPSRVRLHPLPGRATERHVLRIHDREDRLCELVDGVLVEKIMGLPESVVAITIGRFLDTVATQSRRGFVSGADGMMRIMPRMVRIPDVAFTSWDKVPGRLLPRVPIPDLVPDLAVEVLSEGNTPGEMSRKLKDYFFSGVRLVWFVDLTTRSVTVFTAPDQSHIVTSEQTLDGGDTLPGLAIPVREIFAALAPEAPAARKPRKPGPGNRPRRNGNR